jgi:transcription-repair coupling factor (superfamily II helicase)
MTKDELLSLLSEVPTVDRVAAALKDEGAKLRIKGLAGSAIAFVAANVVKQTDRHHLFILSDREEAAYFLSDLELLMGKKKVLFFPMSYRRPYEQEQTDNSNVIQRGEVLNAIQSSSGHPDHCHLSEGVGREGD